MAISAVPFPWKSEGNWYKGNLHCHTSESDGAKSKEEVVRLYRDRGYDFLSITDHRVFSHWKELEDKDFLILPGIETDLFELSTFKFHHMVGVQGGRPCAYRHGQRMAPAGSGGPGNAEEMQDELVKNGLFTIYCHPQWSRVELADFIDLEKIINTHV